MAALIKEKANEVNVAKNDLAVQLKSDKHQVSRQTAVLVMAAFAEAHPSAAMPDWAVAPPSKDSRQLVKGQAAKLAEKYFPRYSAPAKRFDRAAAQK